MNTTPLPAPLLLSLLPGIGAGRYWDYVEHFGSAACVLATPSRQLPNLPTRAGSLLDEYQQHECESELAMRAFGIVEKLQQVGAALISIDDEAYPALLKRIHRAPPLLYAKGNKGLLHHPQIAIVGTRNPTIAGNDNAEAFSDFLGDNGFTITSGLALGIDGIAHQAALKTLGSTIAVMATGIDTIYPQRHRPLAAAILENNGLLVTEFSPGTPPLAARFPQRNRIISGLSIGTLIVEAALKSGSLITAEYATAQNREVFCIPGSIHNPQSKGCHKLIKQGAHLVETASDIVSHCQGMLAEWSTPEQSTHRITINGNTEEEALSDTERTLLELIGYEAQHLETIAGLCSLNAEEISAGLLMLELKGKIKQGLWGYERCKSKQQ